MVVPTPAARAAAACLWRAASKLVISFVPSPCCSQFPLPVSSGPPAPPPPTRHPLEADNTPHRRLSQSCRARLVYGARTARQPLPRCRAISLPCHLCLFRRSGASVFTNCHFGAVPRSSTTSIPAPWRPRMGPSCCPSCCAAAPPSPLPVTCSAVRGTTPSAAVAQAFPFTA